MPTDLLPPIVMASPSHLEHFCFPMVHPITGETISSCKKLMHDPATAETWQTAFGKDFGGMTQGDDKTGQKVTNEMFVMNHKAMKRALENKKKFAYGNPVVDSRPQKDNPHQIRITAGHLRTFHYRRIRGCSNAPAIFLLHLFWSKIVNTKNLQIDSNTRCNDDMELSLNFLTLQFMTKIYAKEKWRELCFSRVFYVMVGALQSKTQQVFPAKENTEY
jgi:hypothetical protein